MNHPEWYNDNSNRRYPFVETASLTEKNNIYTLSDTFIVDCILAMSLNYQGGFYLSKLVYSPEVFTLEVSLVDQTLALTGTIQDIDPNASNFTVELVGVDDYVNSYGRIVVGNISDLCYGEFTYIPAATEFEPCKIIKLSTGISGINGIRSGNVVFTTGTNTVITVQDNQINIDTFDGLCACRDNPCVETVNGQKPVNGNVNVAGIGCVNVGVEENGIQISNSCEEACCGCDPINDIVDRINALADRVRELESTS